MYEASLRCSPTHSSISTLQPNMPAGAQHFLPQSDTGVVYSGATHLYIHSTAPHVPPKQRTPKISVGTATGHIERFSANAALPIPQFAEYFPTIGYIMPSFTNTLVGFGPIYNEDYTVLFANHNVKVFSPRGKPNLMGWRENEMLKLWRFFLRQNKEPLLHHTLESTRIIP